jgi:hypothetical protein
MKKIRHTCAEWEMILASYIYECTDSKESFMSDQSYDHLGQALKEEGTTIPHFDPNSGQWIHKLIENKEYAEIIGYAYNWWKRYLEIDKHTGISTHCLIASEHIKDKNSYKTFPGYDL